MHKGDKIEEELANEKIKKYQDCSGVTDPTTLYSRPSEIKLIVTLTKISLAGQTLLRERESGNCGQSFVTVVSFCAAQKNH